MRQECGEHELYTSLKKSFWADNGTGMLAMYKTDFETIGGMNFRLCFK